MRNFCIYILLFTAVFFIQEKHCIAQVSEDVVHVEDNMLTIYIDKRNTDEFKNLLMYFGLDEDSLFYFGNIGKLKAEGWELISVNKNAAVIGRRINADSNKISWGAQPIFFDEQKAGAGYPGYPTPVAYGVNDFKGVPGVHENSKGETVFTLKSNTEATAVFLSGNFNSWSTSANPMQKTDSGWIAILDLKPGKYFYKYIVDGNWIYDKKNNLKEEDGYSSYNSTYFRYNYTFHLRAYNDVKNVFLAGSFNNWTDNELRMNKTADGWKLDMYLSKGTHTYKFVVDNNWILDPDNKTVLPDAMGHFNSSMSLGDSTLFTLKGYTNARLVMLTGSFNNWNTGEIAMEKTASGWQIPYVLPPGNHEYKFIVDGIWITDPDNLLQTGNAEHINSVVVVSPNYTFMLNAFPEAKEVLLSGSFNNWAEPGYKMEKKNGVWSLPLYLVAGKYTYKYVVDGNWILDPGNNLMEENEFSTGNSVLWIEPEKEYSGK